MITFSSPHQYPASDKNVQVGSNNVTPTKCWPCMAFGSCKTLIFSAASQDILLLGSAPSQSLLKVVLIEKLGKSLWPIICEEIGLISWDRNIQWQWQTYRSYVRDSGHDAFRVHPRVLADASMVCTTTMLEAVPEQERLWLQLRYCTGCSAKTASAFTNRSLLVGTGESILSSVIRSYSTVLCERIYNVST